MQIELAMHLKFVSASEYAQYISCTSKSTSFMSRSAMRNAPLFMVVLFGLQYCAGCGEDKSTNPPVEVPTYSVSGTVYTPFASFGSHRADKLTMVFVDSLLNSQTAVTDNEGHYAVDSLAAGPVLVSMFSTDTILSDSVYDRHLLLYRPWHQTIPLSRDTVIDFTVRRLELAFGDVGYNPEKWAWEYGVRNEDGKYIFWYDLRGSDMRMRNNVQLPIGAAILGFAILGEAAPSYASYMDVDWYMNDQISPYTRLSRLFTTTESYWIEEIPPTHPYWPAWDTVDFRLSMEFRRQNAEYIYIKGVYIYYY